MLVLPRLYNQIEMLSLYKAIVHVMCSKHNRKLMQVDNREPICRVVIQYAVGDLLSLIQYSWSAL